MVRFHCSFLVRLWQLDRGGARIEIEHIQSGAKTVVSSLADAVAWMSQDVEPSTKSSEHEEDETGSCGANKPPDDPGS